MSTVSITVLWALNVQTLNDSKLSNTRARIGKKKRKGKKKKRVEPSGGCQRVKWRTVLSKRPRRR